MDVYGKASQVSTQGIFVKPDGGNITTKDPAATPDKPGDPF